MRKMHRIFILCFIISISVFFQSCVCVINKHDKLDTNQSLNIVESQPVVSNSSQINNYENVSSNILSNNSSMDVRSADLPDFSSLFDKAVIKSEFDIKKITTLLYQSLNYTRYGSDSDNKSTGQSNGATYTDNHIISLVNCDGDVSNIIFKSNGEYENVTHMNFGETNKFESNYTVKDIINKAVKYLKIDYSDIWILQASVINNKWSVDIGTSDISSNNGFSWQSNLIIDAKTCEIIKTNKK